MQTVSCYTAKLDARWYLIERENGIMSCHMIQPDTTLQEIIFIPKQSGEVWTNLPSAVGTKKTEINILFSVLENSKKG